MEIPMRVVAYYLTRGSITPKLADVQSIADFIDQGYGTGRQEWPVLRKAAEYARRHRARLMIVHLGKLKYSLSFLRTLEGIDFACLDHTLDSSSRGQGVDIRFFFSGTSVQKPLRSGDVLAWMASMRAVLDAALDEAKKS